MHASVTDWLARVVEANDLGLRSTLEVGAFDVNGSPRKLFSGTYEGVDLRAGPGVDRIADAEALPYEDGTWDVVVSAEMLEHAARPWRCVAEMARVVAPGGWVLATARGFDEWGCWRYHGHPDDHWRFGAASMRLLFTDAGLIVADFVCDPTGPGWFVAARRPARDVYRGAS